MIVDSSALVAIVRQEVDADLFDRALVAARRSRLSAASYVETSIVVDARQDPTLSRRLDELLRRAGVEIVALTARHAAIAREAHRDFGKGSGHPAKLNLGDCFSYALAKDADEPLLYKGDDFVHTDIRSAVPR